MQLCDAGRNSCVLLFAGELICACMFQSRKPRGALRTRALFYLAKQRTFCRLEKLLDGYRYVPPGLSRLVACRCLWMQVGCLGLTGCLWLPVDACGCLLLTGCVWLPEDACGFLGLSIPRAYSFHQTTHQTPHTECRTPQLLGCFAGIIR